MSSLRQIEANRRNALRSTGPRTGEGKRRSRCNAVRHGLTAETVIEGMEDPEDYKAFELSVTSDFDVQTAVERELVLRLASLLWRLRRATAVETGLLQIQSEFSRDVRQVSGGQPPNDGRYREAIFCSGDRMPNEWSDLRDDRMSTAIDTPGNLNRSIQRPQIFNTEIARCFLRLANLDNGAFKRVCRHETALWRQVGQTLFTPDVSRRGR